MYLANVHDYTDVKKSTDPWLVSKSAKALLPKIIAGLIAPANYTVPLSPFDPLVWHRDRAQGLFNFEYRIECYTPEAKRRYGYFTLPILHNGRLIGRLDAKAHRQQALFELKALHLEAMVQLSDQDCLQLALSFARFAHWHQCTQVDLLKVVNAKGTEQKKTARFLLQKTRAALLLLEP